MLEDIFLSSAFRLFFVFKEQRTGANARLAETSGGTLRVYIS
jgi:hypothetical protein